MPDINIDGAIDYNRRQGFSKEEVQDIQSVIGVSVTGEWDAASIAAIVRFQQVLDVDPDGKVWRNARGNTWPRLQASLSGRLPLKVGVWIDDAARQVLTDDYVTSVKSTGFSTVAIMVNRSNTRADEPDWSLLWTADEYAEAASRFQAAGVEVVFTAWPRPRKSQIDQMCAFVGELLSRTGARGFEVDTEGNWTDARRQDFASLAEAGTYLGRQMRAAAPSGTRLELTTYPYHPEFAKSPTIAQYVDVLLPQAYSVHRAGNGWDAASGPGSLQHTALSLARKIPGKEIICGLAAYRQDYPGHTAAEAMSRALETARAEGLRNVRYWSSKWIVGHMRNDYSAAFIARAALPDGATATS